MTGKYHLGGALIAGDYRSVLMCFNGLSSHHASRTAETRPWTLGVQAAWRRVRLPRDPNVCAKGHLDSSRDELVAKKIPGPYPIFLLTGFRDGCAFLLNRTQERPKE